MARRFLRSVIQFFELAGRLVGDAGQRRGVGIPHAVEHVGELGVLGCAVGVDDVPERRRLRRRRFRVEGRDVELGEVGGDVAVAAVVVPAVELLPVVFREVVLGEFGPGHEMAAVVGRQVDAVRSCGWS